MTKQWNASAHFLQLVDEARDNAEALLPEFRVRGVETERRQQLLVPLRTAGAQHVEILLGEALLRALVDRIERVHQAIAERIGINVERRMDEVRDVGPVPPVLVLVADRRAEALLLHVEPDRAD